MPLRHVYDDTSLATDATAATYLVTQLTRYDVLAYLLIMPKRNDTDEILTTGQVAAEWRVSPRTIQRYIANGQLKATRLPGGHTRVRRSDAEIALRVRAESK